MVILNFFFEKSDVKVGRFGAYTDFYGDTRIQHIIVI